MTTAMNQPPRDAEPPGSSGSQGMNQGLQVLSYLIAGIGVYGFLGWVGDHFLGTAFLLPLGIVVGAALGIYVVIKRFTAEPGPGAGGGPDGTTTRTRGRV
ncbi:AtpZ/AtpI family protein [Friedmanniella luteola]|uniref:AtpZ/AtpI family protein n=1 Tax=Friedmanniella luteola TaxID=546871 RepID=UPI0012FE211B|nr:AtpZ/AtpI family protein [Friedmanniella luteola]